MSELVTSSIGLLGAATKKTTGSSSKTTSRYQTGRFQETVLHELTDDGAGSFGNYGTINYAGKALNIRFVELDAKTSGYKSDYEDAATFEQGTLAGGSDTKKGGEYSDNTVSEEMFANSTVSVTYSTGFAGAIANQASFAPPAVTIDLCPYTTDYIVPGSVRFTWMGHVFEDYDGVLIRDRTPSSVGFVAGQVNYSSGIATITDYVVDGPATAFTLDSLFTVRQKWTTASVFFRTPSFPLKPGGLVMNLSDSQGNSITATAGLDGVLTGPHLRGKVEFQTGIGELQFGDYVLDSSLTAEQKAEWWYNADDVGAVQDDKIWRPWPVDPTTLRINSVSYFYLPLDADILGIDPVRLPQDGRVPIFRRGGFAVVGHTGEISATVSNGQTINCGRVRLSRVRVIGADGIVINTGYTADLNNGLVTFTNVTGYSQPVTVEHRIEDMAMVRDVQITGEVSFTRQLSHDFPAGSVVSSALITGDQFARSSLVFDQSTWDGSFKDTVVGLPATGTYNVTQHPIEVTNRGALTERWAIRFTNTTSFEVIGENVGLIATGNTATDCAPINPATGVPYFTIKAAGWGGGWATGNVLRHNTIGATPGVWVVRTTQQGPETVTNDSFTILIRGDVNTD